MIISQDYTIVQSSKIINQIGQKGAPAKNGSNNSSFHPFEMPIDLEKPAPDEDVVSYTVTSQESERMTFRGVIFQPWCHVIATK